MKFLLAALIAVAFIAEAWSLTCYRCGGASTDCAQAPNATVTCDSPDLPDAVYGCRVYTVNYTTLGSVIDIKGCCFYEDCNEDPCKDSSDAVCSKVASCQSDKCNYNYATAKGFPKPTMPDPTASGVAFTSLAGLVMTLAVGLVLHLSI
ncbi:hypothetical protein ACROYT_G007842 [Oculina patagonica]